MARKTYIPTLIRTLKFICRYILVNRQKIEEYASEWGITNAASKLDAIMASCEALVEEANEPVGP